MCLDSVIMHAVDVVWLLVSLTVQNEHDMYGQGIRHTISPAQQFVFTTSPVLAPLLCVLTCGGYRFIIHICVKFSVSRFAS